MLGGNSGLPGPSPSFPSASCDSREDFLIAMVLPPHTGLVVEVRWLSSRVTSCKKPSQNLEAKPSLTQYLPLTASSSPWS